MEPNPLAIGVMCLAAAAALIFLFWLNHRLRVPPKREEATPKRRAGALEIVLSYILGAAEPVNDYEDGEPIVMSRGQNNDREISSSSLQTRPQTASDQTEDPRARRAKLLDTYRVLRKLGMNRDDARALLKPWDIPLDNNLWSQAAPPPEEPQEKAPISGRALPPNVKFHEDEPELQYQPLR